MDVKDLERNYQVVVLKSPYHFMSDQAVRNQFADIWALKIAGYGKEYPTGVLPFDTSDFIATHIALCERTPQGLRPVMGFKAVDLETCDHHRVTFPIFGMVMSPDDTSDHRAYFEQMVDGYRQRGEGARLAYNGSFTVHPDMRANPDFMAHMWDLVFFMISAHYINEGIEKVVAVCATKFKVDKKKTTRGWDYCMKGGQRLEGYRSIGLYEADLIPMEMNDIRQRCQVHASLFPALWEQRLVYAPGRGQTKIAA